MGNFMSRQNAAVEETNESASHAYKYPPRMGNFFGSHFIMGGERFDTPQPESYLFGENADLNFLGNRPTAFPYPPPQTNEPTKTLKSLVNIRKESVRFVRIANDKKSTVLPNIKKDGSAGVSIETVDGNVMCNLGASGDTELLPASSSYNIEFTFDSDAKCAITLYYFCTEEVSPSGVTLVPRDGLTSETYHFEKGINQYFSQPGHIFNPQLIPEDDLIYNASKEQYPVAIHCVVEEGNEECRQSHTTICVIDHHQESNSYVLRALKQKIFVDGLCYLLQEIYGIENKAVNKSSIDEEIDDHGSECVICMSEMRDTLILPCRHLCLCNSCADSLRYQANNCPICRAPFRALLQIRAVQKGISTHVLHQNTPTSGAGDPAPVDVPPGYVPVSLIEALNGPPQYVGRARNSDHDIADNSTVVASTMTSDIKTTSPLKPNSQRRTKIKKNASTCTSTSEVGTITNNNSTTSGGNGNNTALSIVEIENDPTRSMATLTSPILSDSPTESNAQDKLQIVNERHAALKYQKRQANDDNMHNNVHDDEDVDSENEKLSPLLSPSTKGKTTSSKSLKQVVAKLNIDEVDLNEHNGASGDGSVPSACTGHEVALKKSTSLSRCKQRTELSDAPNQGDQSVLPSANLNAEDSDYYTPEDTQNSILSPLCPSERAKSGDILGNSVGVSASIGSSSRCNTLTSAGGVVVGFSSAASNLVKKNLHKKSTSVGNIVGPGGSGSATTNIATTDLKSNNVSSLPDMLDSPISGNSASTRSSSDSYSSSSSTKQLLSSNPTATAANIIVDDKTALQNAVNV